MLTATIGAKGGLALPKQFRDLYGLRKGSLVIVEQHEGGILIRPAMAMPRDTESYTPERRAEFLLNSAVTREDYAWARAECERLGVDPDSIDHEAPPEQ